MKSFGNIAKDGQVRAVASGALTDGKAVIVNSDGTVSAVAGISGGLGSETTFESAGTAYVSASNGFDSNSNRFVIVYYDAGNSGIGTAVVGEVDGTSVTFGTPVAFATGSTTIDGPNPIAFDSTNNKIVIAYRDNGITSAVERGQAIVGTVDPSDNSISFGTAAAFGGNGTECCLCFDSSNDKIVLSFRNGSNSDYGTAAVGTISGTSISFGTLVVYRSATCVYNANAYDTNAGKVGIFYRDIGNSGHGYGIVGTVSGTSISFGSASSILSSSTDGISCTYDSTAQKILVTFQDSGGNNTAQIRTATISGTSFSYGTAAVVNAGNTGHIRCAYNASANNTVVVYRDNTNSGYGTYNTVTVSGTDCTAGTEVVINQSATTYTTVAHGANSGASLIAYTDGDSGLDYGKARVLAEDSTNITAENFIGFSDGAFATTQSATINTTNTIDRNQSSLTAGQTYFVQNDGTLGLTADDPSVTAGTAISSTELIVKG